jgi:hypothetical protein
MIDARFACLLTIAAAFGLPGDAYSAGDTDFTQLAQSRAIHCAFYKGYDTDPSTGGPIMVEGKADSLVHYQNVDVAHSKAQAIYTRMSGSHDVTVIRTGKAIHFIENVAGMYVMTSVHSCLENDEKSGACIMYGAVNSRLFDSAVISNPDKVYEKVKDKADPGFCDYSFIGIREAATSTR